MAASAPAKKARKNAPAKKAGAKSVKDISLPDAGSSYSDRVISDARSDVSRPAGMPDVLMWHQLDRRKRALLAGELKTLIPNLDRLQKQDLSTAPKTVTIENLGDASGNLDAIAILMDTMADVEDLLASIAVDPDAMKSWASSASEGDLLAAFAVFTRDFSLGEANSSSR